MLRKYEYLLKNLDCANCANKIQNKIAENKEYKDVVVNFNTLKLSLYSEMEENDIERDVKLIIEKLEPEVEVVKMREQTTTIHEGHKNIHILRLVFGIIFMIISFNIKNALLSSIFMIVSYVILLSRTAWNALKLLQKKTINESFLITISCIGAYLVGEKFEGIMVILLYEIGKILEERAIHHTRKSISDLMDIKPEYANLKKDKDIQKVSPETVNIGDIIVIKKGEKIPLDGIVMKGEAKINTASLTGESNLIHVKEKEKVLSGSINEDGILEVQVTERYENSTVNKILELVENATDKKAKTETFVNKAAKIYTPIVIILAVIVAIVLPMFTKTAYTESIYRALIFLVISCPCAIAISVPLSYFSGIGKASKEGILIKGSDYLDALGHITSIIFDKTGTLTTGKFGVENIISNVENYTQEDVLKYAALGESFSNHPIAKSILDFYHKQIDKSKIEDYKEISGKGITYTIENKTVKIGNADFVECDNVSEVGTIIYVKLNDQVIGYIVLNDLVKPETLNVIKGLEKQNIKTRMFTGDQKEIALKIGKQIGISEVKSDLLPQDKYKELENILAQKQNKDKKIAFVGDGINDAPVLARADIGISMGGVGASSAIEASDVVIMTDNLEKIEQGIRISKKTDLIIKQNLIFAISVKILVLLMSVFGFSQMWQAIFADVGVTLITIFNTLRILK